VKFGKKRAAHSLLNMPFADRAEHVKVVIIPRHSYGGTASHISKSTIFTLSGMEAQTIP
jgi:hypothetical protein